MSAPLVLPTGIENFAYLIEEQLDFVDKSLFIKEVLDDRGTAVVVITRPRRFGKTLNLSMLHHFLAAEVARKSTKNLFNTLKIAECDGDYLQHQGKSPVISVTFKDIKQTNFDDAYSKLYEIIVAAYDEHSYLENSDKLTKNQKYLYDIIINRTADRSQLENSLKVLTECLYTYHGINPWLLIDEYDTPIQTGYINNFYDEIINVMRGIFSTALKTNIYLKKAVVTGILRIAKESLFSGLNNVKACSILEEKYAQHFGFTQPEVDALLKKAGMLTQRDQIKEWYNGYQFGNSTVYNPWSINNFIADGGKFKTYWINTSDNELIRTLLKSAPLDFKIEFERLLAGNSVEKNINENMVFRYLHQELHAVWSLLLFTGYLKPISAQESHRGIACQLVIPNREVKSLFRQIIEEWLADGDSIESYEKFINSLVEGDMPTFEKHLARILLHVVSYHDFAKEPEAFYHGLMLGFTASLFDTHVVQSNRESGSGRFDIALLPREPDQLAIIIELKIAKSKTPLRKAANDALAQIDALQYQSVLDTQKFKKILKIGIGFRDKQCVLVSQ